VPSRRALGFHPPFQHAGLHQWNVDLAEPVGPGTTLADENAGTSSGESIPERVDRDEQRLERHQIPHVVQAVRVRRGAAVAHQHTHAGTAAREAKEFITAGRLAQHHH